MKKVVIGVVRDFKRFFWPTATRNKIIRLGGLALVVFIALRFLGGETEVSVEAPAAQAPAVTLTTPLEVVTSDTSSFVGTVRAVSEAQIQNEIAGRVTSVAVRPGETVSAGTIIATLENSSERAAVLQAEGAYESALAAAAQSNTSVATAENNLAGAQNSALTTYRNAYNTVNAEVLGTIDQFYQQPQSNLPSLRIDTRGNTETLRAARVALQSPLENWRVSTTQTPSNEEYTMWLSEAVANTNQVLAIVDIFIDALGDDDNDDTLNGQEANSYVPQLTNTRSALTNTVASLQAAATSIENAEEALTAAEIASQSNTTVSAADAQVKSALGSLRSAQAQLAKTILRTPISGTVNDVSINTGDFISSFTQVAEVANNGSLEVVFSVTEDEVATLSVGQTIRVNNTATGTIVSVAPAVNQATQKTEVRAAVSDGTFVNGSSVTITPLTDTTDVVLSDTVMRLPLTAVRFTARDGSVFVVNSDNVLESRPVELGAVRGSTVIIESGIAPSDSVVRDARGLTGGQTVTIVTN